MDPVTQAAVNRLVKALEHYPRGTVNLQRARARGWHQAGKLVTVAPADIVAACDAVPAAKLSSPLIYAHHTVPAGQVVSDLRKGSATALQTYRDCGDERPGFAVTVQADDVYHLLELLGVPDLPLNTAAAVPVQTSAP